MNSATFSLRCNWIQCIGLHRRMQFGGLLIFVALTRIASVGSVKQNGKRLRNWIPSFGVLDWVYILKFYTYRFNSRCRRSARVFQRGEQIWNTDVGFLQRVQVFGSRLRWHNRETLFLRHSSSSRTHIRRQPCQCISPFCRGYRWK